MTVPPPEPPLALLQYWQRFPKRELRLWLNWGGGAGALPFMQHLAPGLQDPSQCKTPRARVLIDAKTSQDNSCKNCL